MKKITIKDVAEYAGVSITTASFALNNITDRVNAQTQEKVLKAAKELGYIANVNAAKLRSNETNSIMLVYSQVFLEEQNANITQFISSTIKAAKQFHKDVIIKSFHPYDNWDKMIQSYSRIWISRKVDGIIFLCATDDNVPDYVFTKLYNEHNVNLVIAGSPNRMHKDEKRDFPTVYDDLYSATYNALNKIISKGYEEIFYLGMNYDNFYPIRFRSYLDFIKNNQTTGKLLTYDTVYRTNNDIWNLIQPIIKNQEKDIAFMCWNDIDAISVLELIALNAPNRQHRIGVMGYDNISTAAHTVPSLTTIQNPYEEIAKLCVSLVCKQINKRSPIAPNIIVDAELIERDSL